MYQIKVAIDPTKLVDPINNCENSSKFELKPGPPNPTLKYLSDEATIRLLFFKRKKVNTEALFA
jgi:hypothetical protein